VPTLSPVDLGIVVVYVLAMTMFGVWFTNKQKDLKTYFVGERNVGWFLVLMSIVATETSAVTFLSVPGLAYKAGGNLTYLQLALGYILGRCVVAWVLLPMYMNGELFSAYEVLKQKFGPGVQRVASAIFLITRTIADGLRLYLTALLLQYVGVGVESAIVLTGVVTMAYTYLGGMKAVLWTDLIQFVIKIAGAALAGLFVLMLLPGGWSQFVELGTTHNKFQLFDLQHSWEALYPFNLWAGVVGGAVFSMASHGADQLMVQRYLCARNLGHARAALVLSGITVTLQFLLFLGVGIGIFALVQSGVFVLPERPGGAWKPDEMFGLFIVNQLPVGVRGILVAAVLAAAMSTLSSSLNSSANALVTDFYKPLRPKRTEKHFVTVSRVLTAVWGCAQMGVAVVAYRTSGEDKSVVEQVLKVAGMTTGLLLGLFLLGQAKKPVSARAAIIGLISGFTVVVLAWLPEGLGMMATTDEAGTKQLTLIGVPIRPEFLKPFTAWPWFALIGSSVTVLVALLLSRLFDGCPATPANRSPQSELGSVG
jgi:SSS family solute:Na+ symporter